MTNLQELAASLHAEIRGPGDYPISGVRDVERLKPDDLLEENKLYFIENLSVFKRHPKAPERGAVLTIPALAERFPRALVVPEAGARVAFFALLKRFDRIPVFAPGVSPDARVHPTARVAPDAAVLTGATIMEGATVGPRCVLYPGVVIEPHAVVGEGSVLYPNVVIGHHCVVGKDCLIHGGTVIGSDGFGFFDQPGKRHKVPQIGNVVLGDDVELGSGCTLDRATIETTSIGDHTKLDNQVHIGHNCRVGRFCYIAGNTGLAGSVVVEDGVMISGMVSIKDHLTLAKGSVIMGMSGVAQDTEPKTAYFGTPARPARRTHKMNAALE
ncbi:MAG: UDP-3-O-(3-hydroxymyristoyl)glucosamine N-acyltransferase, partial [Elusimicrobia bacterium]|nr:UDP-3-O-(3-hydroxymyristoyl)glucosamine N-acyltransferase [Elusimicrobiota bacterium]